MNYLLIFVRLILILGRLSADLSILCRQYLIFECVANVFAEVSDISFSHAGSVLTTCRRRQLTYFADREFYQDFWNSTTFDEFSRKWNVPVSHHAQDTAESRLILHVAGPLIPSSPCL